MTDSPQEAKELRGAKLNASATDDLDQVLEEGARKIEAQAAEIARQLK